eukprot:CAMPEP_0175084718 /NCGR_PEP_ID=MMETSP0052_2-20121109/28230_1 /TAXON_ID=51329 ORGANISM="Polytomella parva, Strain SAG 63-3" /NCGR_SAMPLE_ID=MMETSP0052_2 /ASSEMBLY_ACC=CAM_ASM_000194 /LENGTH=587 /DNA_ID=CAMNT_0016356583 /DNA_START=84 /DNA_END=1847 /DNA_ORIENTATION=+
MLAYQPTTLQKPKRITSTRPITHSHLLQHISKYKNVDKIVSAPNMFSSSHSSSLAPNFFKSCHRDFSSLGPVFSTSLKTAPVSEFHIRKFGVKLNKLLSSIHKRALFTSTKFHECLGHFDGHYALNPVEDLQMFESLIDLLESMRHLYPFPGNIIDASLAQALNHLRVLKLITRKSAAGHYQLLQFFYFARDEPLRQVILRSEQYRKLLQEAIDSHAWDAQDISELIDDVSAALTSYPISHFNNVDTQKLIAIAEEAASDHEAVLQARLVVKHLETVAESIREQLNKRSGHVVHKDESNDKVEKGSSLLKPDFEVLEKKVDEVEEERGSKAEKVRWANNSLRQDPIIADYRVQEQPKTVNEEKGSSYGTECVKIMGINKTKDTEKRGEKNNHILVTDCSEKKKGVNPSTISGGLGSESTAVYDTSDCTAIPSPYAAQFSARIEARGSVGFGRLPYGVPSYGMPSYGCTTSMRTLEEEMGGSNIACTTNARGCGRVDLERRKYGRKLSASRAPNDTAEKVFVSSFSPRSTSDFARRVLAPSPPHQLNSRLSMDDSKWFKWTQSSYGTETKCRTETSGTNSHVGSAAYF